MNKTKYCYVCGIETSLKFFENGTLKTKGFFVSPKDFYLCKRCKKEKLVKFTKNTNHEEVKK